MRPSVPEAILDPAPLLPTLASRNHSFDTSTPTGADYQTGGAPAPPRDQLATISDPYDLFTFPH